MTETAPETVRLTADVALFTEIDGRLHVLAIRRRWAPFAGCWALPGGHVDAGEGTVQAARRELAEETGLNIGDGILSHVGVYAAPGRDPRGRYVTFAYAARVSGAPAPVAADDASEAQWRRVDDILTRFSGLAFDHVDIVRDALPFVV